jgi:Chaperone of endosialidase
MSDKTIPNEITPNDTTIDNLFVSGNVGIGIKAPGPATARLELKSQDSGIGTIKLFPNSGAGRDFSYDGGPDNLFLFSHYGQENGITEFIWDNGASARRLLTIKNTGKVGIGTTNPRSMLHIGDGLGAGYRSWMERGTLVSEATDNVFFGLKREGDNDRQDAVIAWGDNPIDVFRFIFTENAGSPDGQEIMRLQANGNVGDVRVTGDVYARGQKLTSSRELKENIAELSGKEAVEALKNLNPVKFNFKADSDKNLHLGFIAEDVPELVATSDRKTLSPMDIVAVLTQALKEQQNTISALAEKVKFLEAKTA